MTPTVSLTFEFQLKVFTFTVLSLKRLKEAVNLEVGLDFVGTIVRSLYWTGKKPSGEFVKRMFVPDSTPEYTPPNSPKQCLCFLLLLLLLLFIAFASQANGSGGFGYYHNSMLFTLKSQREKNYKERAVKGSFKTNHLAPGKSWER